VPLQKSLSSADLLPFMPALVQSARDEAYLLQQTTFLRRQLTLASSETKKMVQRLAGESHLVAPDAGDVDAWGNAAEDSSSKTETFINEQIESGTGSIQTSKVVLANLMAKKTALAHLKGAM
jgi:hypothetical protein